MILSKIRNFDRTLKDYMDKTQGTAQLPYLAYVKWGVSLAETSNIDDAIEKLETSILMHPNSPIVYINLAQLFIKKEQYNEL